MNIQQALSQAKQEFGKLGYLINSGECEDFALRVIGLMGDYSEDLTEGTPDFDEAQLLGHYWIEFQGKYYDAECSEGVHNWRDLPIFTRPVLRG